MIEGVAVVPLRRIPDERGTVLHMLRRTDDHFSQFGEIYFSTVYPGVVTVNTGSMAGSGSSSRYVMA